MTLTVLFGVRFALFGMILGGDFVAGGGQGTPTLDSETRFLSTLAIGYVVLSIWLIPQWEEHPRLLALLAGITFLGGVMRLVSWAIEGAPERQAIIASGLEIALPVLVVFCLSRHERVAV